MKTRQLFYLIFLFSLILTSCSVEAVKASSDIVTEERILPEFTEVNVSNDIQIVIKQGATQSVKVTTSDNIQRKVSTKVNGRKLTIKTTGIVIRDLSLLKLEITMPTITSLVLSSDSFGTLSGFVNLDALRIKVSSDSYITLLSGSSNSMDIDASSDARVEGFGFESKTCNVNCSSNASISITCLNNLSGSVSSDAVVFFKGNPTVNVSTSSDGSIINSN